MVALEHINALNVVAHPGKFMSISDPPFDIEAVPSSCSIKRRSAFINHLKKHGIDPSTVDIDAAAPPTFSLDMPHIPPMDTSSQAPLGFFDNTYQPTYISFPNCQLISSFA